MRRGTLRLLHLREQTEAVEETMIEERSRFTALEKQGPTRAISAFNLFQTPVKLADQMAELLGDLSGKRVLEPSAGLGRLYLALRRQSIACDAVLVEIAPQCSSELYRATSGDLNCRLIQADFLECDQERLGGFFDCVVMNPPFKQGRDIKHINHAYSLLKPGGLLVGLCFNGTKQNTNLKPIVDTWEVLPACSFRESNTKASVALVTWRKRK